MNSAPATDRLKTVLLSQSGLSRKIILGCIIALPLFMAGCASNEYCANRKCGEPTPAPAPAPAAVEEAPAPKPFAFQKVYFAFDHSDLDTQARGTLDDTVEVLKEHPDLSLSLQGHADSIGTDDYNLALSQRRAVSVRNYLVAHGVDSSRLEPSGYGESKPDASNDTADGRAQNRRVEFVVISH